MKISLVNTLYAPYHIGGAERSVQGLAEGLFREGHCVSVITLGEAHLDRCSTLNGVTVHRVPLENWYWPYSDYPGNAAARAAWKLRDFDNAAMAACIGRVLDQDRPDILLTHSLAGFSVGVWGEATRRRVPIVHTLHDYYLMCPPSAMYRRAGNCERVCPRCLPFAAYRRRASEAVDAAVGVSRFILDRHVNAGFFKNRSAAKVIFNSLPDAQAEGRARSRNGGPLVFGFIGRLSIEKGIEWLLEAFTANARPGERLLVAGKGERRFAEGLKARYSSPSVTFMGHVDAAAFYAQADVVLVPSLWHEPFGKTAIEPLAYGIPVIASNRGGLPEIVQDGVTGIIVDPDEPGSLARAMSRFSAEPELAERLGRNCARRLSRFSHRAYIDAYGSLLADVAGDGASALVAGARS